VNIVIKKYNETYVKIEADIVVLQAISEYFSFKAENYQFTPKYKTGQWDGKIRLYDLNKNLFPIGLLFKLHAWLSKQDITIEYVNFDKSNTIANNQQIITFSEDVLKFPFPLRDYQLEAIKTGLCERKGVLLSPTGTGKSAIIYTLVKMILHRNQDYKILIIVPTISLVDQMVGDFDDYSVKLKRPCSKDCQKIFSGQDKQIKKSIVVSTWQSLQTLPKEFFMQFGAVIVDECHTGSTDGKTIKKIVEYCSRAKYKIGTSGTIQDAKLNEYSLNALYGKIYQFTQTSKEIERGNLCDLIINQIFLKYSKKESADLLKEKIKIKQFHEGQALGASLYHCEVNFINKLNYKRNLIESICKKQTDNILVLYRRNSQFGIKLFEQLKNNLTDRQVFLVNGNTDKDIRNEVRKICEKSDNAIIVANYGVFSTGVNIKRLHHIIFGESIKSKISVLQSIGRGLRVHSSKNKVNIYDIVDSLSYGKIKNSILKHAEVRLELYEREQFKVKKWEVQANTFIKESQN